MFLIRRAKPDDSGTLLKLAKMVHFINLPADREIIDGKIAWSRQCFMLAAESDTHGRKDKTPPKRSGKGMPHGEMAAGMKGLSGRSPLFLFVMEEVADADGSGRGQGSTGVVGTSQIISRMGGPGEPNLSLQLNRREMFSQVLQLGVTHTTVKMVLDESGPTEIGGLILQPSFRGHRQKLGRLLSIVRFHFMGLHRDMFSDRVLAEMMGPITADGQNPFWDHCTRAFINMTYEEADRFCQESKEFILSLFPREEIYLTLIPPEARAVVGQVGPETLPARRMLENLGFKHHNRVDPFDGGPHLEATLDAISVVRETKRARLAAAVADESAALTQHGIVSVMDEDGEFRAVETRYSVDKQGRVVLPRRAFGALAAAANAECGYTPMAGPTPSKPAAARHSGKANGKATKRSPAKSSK